jgi:hypothetical protein
MSFGEGHVNANKASRILRSEQGDTSHESRRFIPWWKRTYLVNREFQLRFALSGVVIGLTSSIVTLGMLLWAFWAFNIWQGQRFPLPVMVVIFSTLFLNAGSIYVATVLATQKIVGPLFNLIRQFHKLSRADFEAFAKFREADEIHYVARRFNEMVLKLGARDELLFRKVQEALTALENHDMESAREPLQALIELKSREIEFNRDAITSPVSAISNPPTKE